MKLKLLLLALLTAVHTSAWARCNADIQATSPDERFTVDAANGLVTDKVTGLIWQRCSLGQTGTNCSVGAATTHNWPSALQAGEDSIFAGYSDWRLPNSKELGSIVEDKCYRPSINSTVFPGLTDGRYWSSSPYAGNSSYAWGVNFYNGHDDYDSKGNSYHVRLVRGGQ